MINLIKKILLSIVILFSITGLASAETTISAEGQYIFNTLGFYLGGVLVAFMAAGFCMLECGLRSEERRVGKECRSRWSPYH